MTSTATNALDPRAAERIARFAPFLRAVALDVDGTLTDAEHRLSPGNLAALRRLDEAGVPIVVVTGRALSAAAATLLDAGLHGYVAACNGSLIVDLATEERVRVKALDPEVARELMRFAKENDVTCTVFTATDILIDDPGPQGLYLRFMAAANTGTMPRVADLADVPYSEALKIMIAAAPERLDELEPRLREISPVVERSLDGWVEACHPEATKWAALAIILGRMGIDPAHVAGAGDGGNDISWLSRVGLSAAMANARPELKAITDVVIGHHLDDAAARFLDALIEARA